MPLFAIFVILLVVNALTCSTTATRSDVVGTMHHPQLDAETRLNEEIPTIHIILEGIAIPLGTEQLQAVHEAFTDSYNEVFGSGGFRMVNVNVVEQRVYKPERRKFLRSTTTTTGKNLAKIRFEPTKSYLTLVTKLHGTHYGPMLVDYHPSDTDDQTMRQRVWEQRACQKLQTGKQVPITLEFCLMTRSSDSYSPLYESCTSTSVSGNCY